MRQKRIDKIRQLVKQCDTEERVIKVCGIVKTVATVNKHTGEVLETLNWVDLGAGKKPESETRF
jgi:hypothetical protein